MSQPLPFFLDQITDDVTQDFADRGISAKILVGEWETFRNETSPKVIFGLRDGGVKHVGDDTRRGMGAWFPTGPNTVARPLWANAQKVIVWVSWPPPQTEPDPAKRPRAARARTWALAQATLAALWRSNGGVLNWDSLQWIHEDRGAATYGAALSFEAVYAIPILDDEELLGSITGFGTTTELDLPDGTLNPPEGPSVGP